MPLTPTAKILIGIFVAPPLIGLAIIIVMMIMLIIVAFLKRKEAKPIEAVPTPIDNTSNSIDTSSIDTGSADQSGGSSSAVDTTEYVFFPSLDSNGNDLVNGGSDMAVTQQKCSNLNECVAYNTDGWLKSSLTDTSKWTVWNDLTRGIYVNASNLPVSTTGIEYISYSNKLPNKAPYITLPPDTSPDIVKLECDLRSDCAGYATGGKLYTISTNMSLPSQVKLATGSTYHQKDI